MSEILKKPTFENYKSSDTFLFQLVNNVPIESTKTNNTKLEVVDFPSIVVIDSDGNNLYEMVLENTQL